MVGVFEVLLRGDCPPYPLPQIFFTLSLPVLLLRHPLLLFILLPSPLLWSPEWLKLHIWSSSKRSCKDLKVTTSRHLATPARHSWRHLLEHHIKGVTTALCSASPLWCETSSKSLGKDVSHICVSKCLSEDFIQVNVSHSTCRAFSKLIIVPPLTFVAQCCIRFSYVFECIHRTGCLVLVRVNFQCELQEFNFRNYLIEGTYLAIGLLDHFISCSLFDNEDVIEVCLC